ncbi:MAG: coproporphyrinogen III oxidase [Bacteroidetes bacterium 43-93]|nr:radical SAM family heme chaperone HemW [Bacteroidota bacterium]OJW99157.1 MAG: coproporphyrinogen III oxidase [Bacteroidetes bacterium 43-93]
MAGIYIHIPFCRQACNYCNFHFSTSLKLKGDLLLALHKEIELQKDYLSGETIETVYIGGGTPSLLSISDIQKLFDSILKNFKVDALKEFTLEANPDDLTKAYLQELRTTNINRFSIGVQSFRDEDLRYMNRAHNAQQADYAIKAAQDAGFTNLSIDLIYGVPGLSNKDWINNLARIKELDIPHFSSYALTVEEGTALHHNIRTKKTAPVNAEQSAMQFDILAEQADLMGYEQYEISNLAKPGHRAIHNTNYWLGKPYLGLGPSAHSFDGNTRRWNIANNALYIKSLLLENKLSYEEEILTKEQQLNEYIMTSLRTSWGCDLSHITTKWGSDYVTQIMKDAQQFIEQDKILLKDNHLLLTLKGKLWADRIAGELFI